MSVWCLRLLQTSLWSDRPFWRIISSRYHKLRPSVICAHPTRITLCLIQLLSYVNCVLKSTQSGRIWLPRAPAAAAEHSVASVPVLNRHFGGRLALALHQLTAALAGTTAVSVTRRAVAHCPVTCREKASPASSCGLLCWLVIPKPPAPCQ